MRYLGFATAFLAGLLLGEVAGFPGLVVGALLFLAVIAMWLLNREAPGPTDTEAARGWRAVELELSRSRRMERTFCLARVAVGDGWTVDRRTRLLRAIQDSTRDIDAAWWSGADVLILLSESTSARVRSLIGRLQAQIPSRSAWAIAEFPRDGLTLQALLAALDERAASAARLEVSDGTL